MEAGRCLPRDLGRALFCAEAVCHGSIAEIEMFLKRVHEDFAFTEFGEVHLSVDLNPSHGFKFLTALAADAVFIAFQASGVPGNSYGSDFSKLKSGGVVDRWTFELSDFFRGSDLYLLSELCRRHKRIVFCGNGFGGAVSHMVVLYFFDAYYSSGGNFDGEKCEMISIAFGAPSICRSDFAAEVNGNEKLKCHFFNFLHADDPIISKFRSGEDHDDGDSADEAGRAGFRDGRIAPYQPVRLGTDQVKRRVSRNSNSKNPQQWELFPIGEITFLESSLRSGPSTFAQQFRNKPLQLYHSYESALRGGLEGIPPISTNNPSDPGQKLVLKVTTPAPEITSAKLKAMDSGRKFIRIKGSNLLFLRERVQLNGFDAWETKIQTDTELCIVGPTGAGVETNGGDVDDALSFVVVKTAFGTASHLVLEDNMSGGPPTTARRLLSKIVQVFIVLAGPKLCYLFPSEVLDDLDNIVQCNILLTFCITRPFQKAAVVLLANLSFIPECVPGLACEAPSKLLRKIADESTREEVRVENIKEVNTVVKQVVQFLTSSLTIKYVGQMRSKLLFELGLLAIIGGMLLLPASGVWYIISEIPTLLSIGATFLGGGAASMIGSIILGKNELMIPDYLEILKCAIAEAQNRYGTNSQITLPEITEAALEGLLLTQVKPIWTFLEEDVEKIRKDGIDTDLGCRSPRIGEPTSRSRNNLLVRMQIVAKTVHMYNTWVNAIKFVGVVGAEDAGKSTFIKKAIKCYGDNPDADVPHTGFKKEDHTTMVKPYKLHSLEKLWLVDFPGSNGTGKHAEEWKQFTLLPSSCILLFEFTHDVKRDQVKMYQDLKNDLDSKEVTIVFNKVDEKFQRKKQAAMNKEYFTDLRNRAATEFGCDSKDVHYACLDPDIPEDKFAQLQKAGVLNFKGLAEKVLAIERCVNITAELEE